MEAYEQLLDFEIKPSVQRIAIMDYLLNHRTHPSVDEIYSALCPSIPTLSKTTVYNTLKLFTENGAALMLTIDDKNACFDGDTSPHAHFLCKSCGRVYDLPLSHPEPIAEVTDACGHAINEVHLYYKGICKECLLEMKY